MAAGSFLLGHGVSESRSTVGTFGAAYECTDSRAKIGDLVAASLRGRHY